MQLIVKIFLARHRVKISVQTINHYQFASFFYALKNADGEFAVRILQGVEKGCKLVVIDSLNGYLNAMPGEKYLNNQLHELCSSLNQQGIITILILPLHGLVGTNEAPVDLSYLADSVVTLRYFEAQGEVKQALAVVKKRSGAHEKTIREFKLESAR